MPRPILLGAIAALIALAWYLPNRPHFAGPDLPRGKLNSISLAPYRDGQSPLTGTFPSPEQVAADIALLAPHTSAIRTYAANEGDYDVATLAAQNGLKLWQGIWLGADRAANRREIDRAIAAARAHPDTIDRVIVGNEVLLRRDLPPAELIAAIDEVRAAIPQTVTYAEVWEFWEQFPEVAAHVDLITIHLLPYWEDTPTAIDAAIAHVQATYYRIAAKFPGKPIVIGETGWPSRGRPRADADPGRVNQARFIRGFIAAAQKEGFEYNLIEAFDQTWKARNEGTVGANWGLWTANRAPKFELTGLLSENPDWLTHALAAIGLGLALATLAPTRAALALLLGAALAYALFATWPDAFDRWQTTAAIANLTAQTSLAILLLRRTPGTPSKTFRDSTRRLRRARPTAPFDDLTFLFCWAAAVLQLLLLFDPRYRDFPIPTFAVPLLAILARAIQRDLPVTGGTLAEALAGGTLALAALAGAVQEGPKNVESLLWTACDLILAAPPLLRLVRR